MELEVVVADGTAKVSEPTEDQSLLNARAGGGVKKGRGCPGERVPVRGTLLAPFCL